MDVIVDFCGVADFYGVEVGLDQVRSWAEHSADVDTILCSAFGTGCSMVGSMAVLDAAGIVPLAEAKARIVTSPVWADQAPRNRRFQESLSRALDELEADA